MSATELVVGSLQQSTSSSMASSPILSLKPLHPTHDFGRSLRQQLPSWQASMAHNEDRSATLPETRKKATTRGSNVSSLLRAVQEGGSSAVMQQVSSIRQFFMPEVSLAIFTEIKKRMGFSFKDDDDGEESSIQDDLNGGLLGKTQEEEVTQMGPRCAWPRLKLVSIEEELKEEAVQGPRCAWPRAVQAQSHGNPVQQGKQDGMPSFAKGEGEIGGAKCAWPRVTSRRGYQGSREGMGSHRSSAEGLHNGHACKSSQEGSAPSNSVQEGKEGLPSMADKVVTEGPRCAWPRNTPRRMLATGVGLSLMNYLFIGQGAPAVAILLDSPLPIIPCGEDLSLSSGSQRHSLCP